MGCFAVARTDLRLVIGNLQDILDSPALQREIADWMQRQLGIPVEQRTIVQGQNVRYYAGPHWLNITPNEATLTGPRSSTLKPQLEKYMKELLANIKIFQAMAVIKARTAVLDDGIDATSGNRVIKFQMVR